DGHERSARGCTEIETVLPLIRSASIWHELCKDTERRRGKISMTNDSRNVKLTAVDHALAFSSASMPQNLIDAWSYTTTFAQAHARTINGDPSTNEYFQAMTKEFQLLAWNVTEATRVSYTQSADTLAPADI